MAARPVRRHLFGDHTPLSEELIRDGLDRFTFDRHPIPVTLVVIAMLVIGFFCAIGWFFFGYG